MLRIALFLALVAGASATSDYPGTATCALLTKSAYCDMVTWVAAAADTSPSTYCSCSPEVTGQCTDTAAIPAKSNGCALDAGDNTCGFNDNNLDTKVFTWMTDDQKKCTNAADEAACTAIAGCIYTKPTGVTGGTCQPTTDSLVATATGLGATALQLAHLKLDMHSTNTCGPLAKDEATCNANLQCAWNKNDKTCTTSLFYLVHSLDSGGCTTEAAAMAKLYNVDVAQANAISTSGAAGFSSFAVVVAALVAALSLIA